ncbi:hypothetical protein B566_EDAN001793 [Ephemera danica]|nr:hypothetical protein B566_EDAN001793 [Ephemera danica]
MLRLGIPPDIRRHYRRNWMDFWNRDLPEMLEDPTNTKMASVKPRPVIKAPPPPLPPPLTGWTQEPFYPDIPPPPFYPLYTPPDSNPHNENGDKREHMDPPIDEKSKNTQTKEIIGDASSMALSIVIIIGVCFLMINCLAFSAIYYQRNRLRVQERRILSSQGIKPATEMQSQLGPGRAMAPTRPVANSEDEDPQQRRRWLIRQCSGSTVDPQTKVRDWIAHEIVQRCSPRFLRRMPRNPGSTATSMDKLSSTTTLNRPAKVSVAVDATPLSRFDNESEELKPGESITLRRSSTCINLTPIATSSQTPSSFNTQCSPPSTTTSFQSQQQLSYPTPDELRNVDFYEQPMAYIHPLHNQDINVTSRRDDDYDGTQGGLSTGTMIAGDALDTIKRRNYPKVLPDNPVPEHSLIKRRSLPHPGYLELLQPPILPISAPTTPTKDGQIKVPPPPPPRTSTLKREHHPPSNVVTQPRVVIKPSAVSKRPSDRGGPRVNPTLSPSSPGDSSDSSTGTIKRPTKPSNNQKSWYAQYNKAVSSPSDSKGTD